MRLPLFGKEWRNVTKILDSLIGFEPRRIERNSPIEPKRIIPMIISFGTGVGYGRIKRAIRFHDDPVGWKTGQGGDCFIGMSRQFLPVMGRINFGQKYGRWLGRNMMGSIDSLTSEGNSRSMPDNNGH